MAYWMPIEDAAARHCRVFIGVTAVEMPDRVKLPQRRKITHKVLFIFDKQYLLANITRELAINTAESDFAHTKAVQLDS